MNLKPENERDGKDVQFLNVQFLNVQCWKNCKTSKCAGMDAMHLYTVRTNSALRTKEDTENIQFVFLEKYTYCKRNARKEGCVRILEEYSIKFVKIVHF